MNPINDATPDEVAMTISLSGGCILYFAHRETIHYTFFSVTCILCDTGTMLYQLSYRANWELVTLWVRSIPVDGEELKRIMEDHIFELRRKIWRSDMIDHRSMSSYLSPQFKYITFQILVHLSYSFIYSFVFFTFYGYIIHILQTHNVTSSLISLLLKLYVNCMINHVFISFIIRAVQIYDLS